MKWGIGIDIGGTKIDVACVNEQGEILLRKKFPTKPSEGSEFIIQSIIAAVKEIQKESEVSATAVGVGMAGQIVAKTGVVKFAPNLGWRNVPLQENLNRALKIPVLVTNDVRAAAWGEWVHGAGSECQNLLCLFIGTGVGAGIIVEGKLLQGAQNSAGELGHTILKINGPLCRCGNYGCLEAMASGWAIAEQAKNGIKQEPRRGATLIQLVKGEVEELTARQVLEAAGLGDSLSILIVEEAMEALAGGCISFVNAFNPEKLILGGGLGMALPGLVNKVKERIWQGALPSSYEGLKVLTAELLTDAGVIGAASLALKTS